MQQIEAKQNDAGQRLDKFLSKYLNLAPKSFLYKMMRKKNIVLNKKKVTGNEILTSGDIIYLFLSDETISKFRGQQRLDYPSANLDILYEDEHVAFINKPAGMLSQQAKAGQNTLVEYFIGYLLQSGQIKPEELERFKPSICNRLDRNTSGVVTAGKSLAGLQILSELLKKRTLDKYYLTLVKGIIHKPAAIEGYLVKNQDNNQVRITKKEGGQAGESFIKTAYTPLRNNGMLTLLKVKLITGKTHQIRGHLASIGHPIVGDGKYGSHSFNQEFQMKYQLRHQLLHGWQLDFPASGISSPLEYLHGKRITAPIPDYFIRILEGEKLEEFIDL